MLGVGNKQSARTNFDEILHWKVSLHEDEFLLIRGREKAFSLPVSSHHATGSCHYLTVTVLFSQDSFPEAWNNLRNIHFSLCIVSVRKCLQAIRFILPKEAAMKVCEMFYWNPQKAWVLIYNVFIAVHKMTRAATNDYFCRWVIGWIFYQLIKYSRRSFYFHHPFKVKYLEGYKSNEQHFYLCHPG